MINVSVIVPVYNTEKYLQDCIDSLLNQTLENIEIIFVNDASSDSSLSILEENQKFNASKMKVINSTENLRQGGARNIGLRVAKGEYIGFVDSDDYIAPDMYEELYNKAISGNYDVVFSQFMSVEAKSRLKDMRGGYSSSIEWNKQITTLDGKMLSDSDREKLMVFSTGGIWAGLWKRNVISENEVFFPEHLKYEDNFWGTLICCYIKKVSFIHKVEYFYRNNPESTTHKYNDKSLLDRVQIEEKLLVELKTRNLINRFITAEEYIFIYRYFVNSFYTFSKMFDRVPYNILKDMSANLKKEFPNWHNNHYYKELFPIKRKIMANLAYKFPVFTGKVSHLIFRTIS